MAEFISKEEALDRLSDLIREISEDGGPCYITEAGQAKAVLLDVDRYHSIMDALESREIAGDREVDIALIERLIAAESRKRKKSIRFFGLKSEEIE